MLESSDAAVVLVGLDLRLIEVSPRAKALLDAGEGLSVHLGRLVPADTKLSAELRRAVNQTIHRSGAGEAAFICERPSRGSPWRLVVLPIVVSGITACLITIADGQPRSERLRMWLTQHYGATRAEVGVAEALLEGRSPDEIAALRGVSITTVRSQVRHLLEKTGAGRITKVVILLARLG